MMLRLFSMLVFFCFATLVSAQEKLAWNENRQLAWDDFQSKDIPISSKAAATTFCGISYLLNSSTKKFTARQVKIEAFFVPSKSWAHKDHKTDFVLMHEQSHFDIAELFARRFRKLISDKQWMLKCCIITMPGFMMITRFISRIMKTLPATEESGKNNWNILRKSTMK